MFQTSTHKVTLKPEKPTESNPKLTTIHFKPKHTMIDKSKLIAFHEKEAAELEENRSRWLREIKLPNVHPKDASFCQLRILELTKKIDLHGSAIEWINSVNPCVPKLVEEIC